ncbi:MAG: sugar phosphate isomerase/epimerase [Spirochaetaceae bacterium]|jgi:sugar phosphate isomerase/epimerase|nr:sugar phosphate isomerase/epimerase [Spirochaetaceae bacterium]
MKLGLVTAILPDLSFEEVVDYASTVGFECLEVCCWPKGKAVRRYAGVTHIDLEDLTVQKMAYYTDYAKERGVSISSLGYYPNPLDADKDTAAAALEHLRKLIRVSAEMGVGMVTTFIGRDKNKTVEENLELFKKTWDPIIKFAEEKQVKIAIENCPMLYTANEWPGGNNLACTPDIWRKMFALIPSANFGLNYDPSHFYLQGASYTKPLYEFRDRIFHVHFKDIKVYQEKLDEYGYFSYPALWHSPKLPGLGGVDFSVFCSALCDIRYNGPACIEVEDKAFEGSPALVKQGIEQSYRYMRQFV